MSNVTWPKSVIRALKGVYGIPCGTEESPLPGESGRPDGLAMAIRYITRAIIGRGSYDYAKRTSRTALKRTYVCEAMIPSEKRLMAKKMPEVEKLAKRHKNNPKGFFAAIDKL